jgi:hypothetical protein
MESSYQPLRGQEVLSVQQFRCERQACVTSGFLDFAAFNPSLWIVGWHQSPYVHHRNWLLAPWFLGGTNSTQASDRRRQTSDSRDPSLESLKPGACSPQPRIRTWRRSESAAASGIAVTRHSETPACRSPGSRRPSRVRRSCRSRCALLIEQAEHVREEHDSSGATELDPVVGVQVNLYSNGVRVLKTVSKASPRGVSGISQPFGSSGSMRAPSAACPSSWSTRRRRSARS